MLAIQGIYDNGRLILEDAAPMDHVKVIVIFPQDSPEDFRRHLGKPVKFGGWEGKLSVSDDFNAPIDDFEEYM